MSTDRLDSRAVTWTRDETDPSVTIRTRAQADLRSWAAGYRATGDDVLADDCDRLADQIQRLYGTSGGAS